ncbi:molybdopterin-dependent oxidoreductase [Bradyrhizobium sp. NP1]|uniref:molybdopterin-containing oxidoreductase family protein n=1 Tax=Bradyrhizobium sp. NP1 TaxID=3049772 RepID=UPI0025A61020|nr:molybdopterin-dependent oxidoreductase [Bradyrhizobium sp. NP1]WJR79227.1 molybdopterin-dependent oxidoreductase [Bradyrhizobium sp. NP1]
METTVKREVRGVCPMDCPDTCAWIVTVENDKPVRVRGDENHPYTRGALCAKMNNYAAHTQHPQRLLQPLLRVGPKGAGSFHPIAWDRALDIIAERFSQIIAEYGAEAIWPYYGCGSFGMLQGLAGAGRRLWNVLSTSQHVMTICTISGGVGTGYTLGDNRMGMDPETIRYAKLIILWGTNTLSSNHHLWRVVQTAKADGAHLVVIDPIKTRTAEQADEHISLIPGTDAALALGLLHVVVSLGAEDREFIERHTLGWEAFRDRILQWPPSRVAEETGVPEATIWQLGERLARTRPTAIRMLMGVQRHGGGGMAVRTIMCIPGVTGDWRHPGGGAAYDTRGFFKGNWGALHRDDLRRPGTRSLSMTRLGEGLLDVSDPPVKALFLYASNPLASAPAQGKIRAGLSRPDLFTVALDQFMTDTAQFADVILPCTSQLEHADLHNTYGHIYISWNEPAVPPPGQCLSASEVFRRLARRLGLKEACLYDSDEEMARQVLASGDSSLEGITLERLKRDGWVRLNVSDPFLPFSHDFPTPSGRLEFYSETMATRGLDPIAGYTPPYEAAQRNTELARKYPLALIAAAKHYQLNSIFANSPGHSKRQGSTKVLIHPVDAASRGITAGTPVRVFNDRGAFFAVAELTDGVRPGLLASTKGAWPSLERGSSTVNATVAERDSDMGGGAVFHDNRVECEAASDNVQ